MSLPPIPSDAEDRAPEGASPAVPPGDAEAFTDLAFDEEIEAESSASSSRVQVEPPHRRFRRRLLLRLALLLFISVFLPLSLEGVWFYYRAKNEAVQLHLRRQEVVLDIVFADLNQWLVQRRARVETALTTHEAREALTALWTASSKTHRFTRARDTLLTLLKESASSSGTPPLYTDFAVIASDHRVLAASRAEWEGRTLDDTPFGPSLKSLLGIHTQDDVAHWVYPLTQTDATDGVLGIGTVFPLQDDNGASRGWLVGLADDRILRQALTRLNQWLPDTQSAFVTADGHVYVWDPDQHTLQKTDQPFLQSVTAQVAEQPRQMVVLGDPTPLQEFLARWGLGSAARLVPYPTSQVSGPFPLWRVDAPDLVGLVGWMEPLRAALVVTSPEAAAAGGVLELLPLRLVVWGVLLAFVVGVAVLFGRNLLRQVYDLARVAEAFAQGRWDQRADVLSNDEIGFLAYTFNKLADRLQETYTTMERTLSLRTHQMRLVVTMASVAMEVGPRPGEALSTILQRMSERFPQFAYLSLRLRHTSEQGWQPGARVSRLPQAANVALRSFEAHLADEVGRTMHLQTWTNDEGEHLPLPPPLNWMVGVPLSTPRQLMGVLFVGGVDANPPDEHDRVALQLLARQLSLVLEYLHLRRGQALEMEKQRVTRFLFARLSALRHSSHVAPILVEGLTEVNAQGVLLLPVPEVTDVWDVAYPAPSGRTNTTPTIRNLLPLIGEGPAHLDVGEGDSLGLASLVRRYGWRTVGLYPVQDPSGRILAVWMRGAGANEHEAPIDRERERLFAHLLGWAFVYADLHQHLSVWEVIQKILAYAPEAPSEGHLYLRAWDLLQHHLPQSDFFVTSYRGGAPATFVYPHGQRYYHTTVTPVEKILIQQVLERGQPLLLSDKHKIIAQAGKIMRVSTRVPESWLGVPVVLGSQRLGVLGLVQWTQARAFSDEHLTYLHILGQGLAGVMYYIQQEGRLRRRIEREQSLRTFAQQLTRSADTRNLLEFSAAEIQRLFEAREVEIELFASPSSEARGATPAEDDAEG